MYTRLILEILNQTEKNPPFSLSRILFGTFSLEIAISFLFYRNKTIVKNCCYIFKIAGKGQSDTWSVKRKTIRTDGELQCTYILKIHILYIFKSL